MSTTAYANNFQVRLVSVASLASSSTSDSVEQVPFEVTPVISVSGTTEYSQITPVHIPGGIQVYKHTNSRQFTLSAKFISRTVMEATQNRMYLKLLDGWRMPYFGSTSTVTSAQNQARNQNSANTATGQSASQYQTGDVPLTPEQRAVIAQARVASEGVQLLGAPPDILYLYGYSSSANDNRTTPYAVNLNRIPVVLTAIDYSYPDDVDYLPTYPSLTTGNITPTSEPFPMRMNLTITLMETHSPREYEGFDLTKYKQGLLINF